MNFYYLDHEKMRNIFTGVATFKELSENTLKIRRNLILFSLISLLINSGIISFSDNIPSLPTPFGKLVVSTTNLSIILLSINAYYFIYFIISAYKEVLKERIDLIHDKDSNENIVSRDSYIQSFTQTFSHYRNKQDLTPEQIKQKVSFHINQSINECLNQSKDKAITFFEDIHDEQNPIVQNFNEELGRRRKLLTNYILERMDSIINTSEYKGANPILTSNFRDLKDSLRDSYSYDTSSEYEPPIKTFKPTINFHYKPNNEVLSSWEELIGKDLDSIRRFNTWLFNYSFIDVVKLFFIDLLIPITTTTASIISFLTHFEYLIFETDIAFVAKLLLSSYGVFSVILLAAYLKIKPKNKINNIEKTSLDIE
ncbi:hypothetical protein CDB75_RS13620 [Vibrio parahaemolyticus]|nr:hypothetical protein [Vibrio parahaemolyticus]